MLPAQFARFAVRGRFVQGVVGSPGELEYVEDGCCVVDAGIITAFAKTPQEVWVNPYGGDGPPTHATRCASQVAAALKDIEPAAQVKLTRDELCCPGMIDTHVHAPQYQFTGTATDLPLMEWLQAYTFPAERRCSDVNLAGRICEFTPTRAALPGRFQPTLRHRAPSTLLDRRRALPSRLCARDQAPLARHDDGRLLRFHPP